jgi:hypothetical protein
MFLKVVELNALLILSKIKETMLFNSFNVCIEYRQGECIVNGSFVAITFDSSRCVFDGIRVEGAYRYQSINIPPSRSHHDSICTNGR